MLDERYWEVCPRCREPLPAPGEELPPAGMLTHWGLGMCGLVAGGMLGLGLAVSLDLGNPPPSWAILWPVVLAALGAAASAWLSRHLMRPARRSFERLMIAAMSVASVATPLTVALWRNPYALGAVIAVGTLAMYTYLRRFPHDWGLEAPRGRQRPDA